jgi:hypothetical protein
LAAASHLPQPSSRCSSTSSLPYPSREDIGSSPAFCRQCFLSLSGLLDLESRHDTRDRTACWGAGEERRGGRADGVEGAVVWCGRCQCQERRAVKRDGWPRERRAVLDCGWWWAALWSGACDGRGWMFVQTAAASVDLKLFSVSYTDTCLQRASGSVGARNRRASSGV